MSNIVAIVGRPNVGKSTLFNRLVEHRQAIMDNVSGVTRDRHYGHSEWNGKYFTVIDTGGYVEGSNDIFEGAIRTQVKLALNEATVILFMVDIEQGLTGLDQEFAHVLREINKPTYLVANKADNSQRMQMGAEFYSLGISEDVHPISSNNGSGTGDLLDLVVTHFEEEGTEDPNAGIPRIAILGRPNVGKSSFVNTLLGEERNIVTDIAGTTRDAINTRYKLYGKDFILTDTAGIRKKAKVKEDIEFYSVLRSLRSLENSDVCIVMIDAQSGLEAQDINIIALAHKHKKGIMIMVNKWDLIEKDTKTADNYKKEMLEKLGGPFDYIPIIFCSVVEKKRIFQAIELATKINDERKQKVTTSELNELMLREIEYYPPPALKGKYVKIKYITQLPTASPTFAFFCNLPQYIAESYQRFLSRKIREHFGFEGVPIKLVFRQK